MIAPRYFLRCLVAVFSWQMPLCVSAQPPNPPPGWTFVRDLDSLEVNILHAVDDTIFMFAADRHVSNKNKGVTLVSFDGGNSWDSVYKPPEVGEEQYAVGVFPNEAKIWFSKIIDSSRTFFISKNGKNYESFKIGIDTTYGLGFEKFFIDPHNPDHWLIVGSFSLATAKNSRLSQSFDGGRTWKVVKVPTATAEKLTFELVFDTRQKDTWYVREILQQHNPMYDTAIVYRTTDNGSSFTPVRQWGIHYSIGYPGEVRRWWGVPQAENMLFGPMIGEDTSEVLEKYNWLQMFHPQLPLPNRNENKYYGRELSNNKNQFFESPWPFYFPSNYLYRRKKPHLATIVEHEFSWESGNRYENSWIYQTYDDWKTWNTIWSSGPDQSVEQTFMDESEEVLWAISKTFTDTAVKTYLYRRSIASTVDYQGIQHILLISYPSPSTGIVNVKLPREFTDVSRISLFDALGNKLAVPIKNFLLDKSTLELVIPSSIPSGCYSLIIQTFDSVYSLKIILQR